MLKPKGFKDIPGYEGLYAVSMNGEIYSYPKKEGRHPNGCILKSFKTGRLNNQYEKVRLLGKDISVHKIVALTYIPNPENKPQVNHKNFDKHDNRIENLEWCSRSENSCYRRTPISVKKIKISKYKGIDCVAGLYRASIGKNNKRYRSKLFKTQKEAAEEYNKLAVLLHGNFCFLNKIGE